MVALASLHTPVSAQTQAGKQDTVLVVETETFLATAAIIIPNTVQIQKIDQAGYSSISGFYTVSDTLFFGNEVIEGDSLAISYRAIKASLFEPEQLLDSNLIAKNPSQFYNQETLDGNGNSNGNGNKLSNDLIYSGSFSRGFSIGNRQDLVLSSDLDLQLSGKIGNEIDILAAISDQNIPLQPEGNTQQLREFDKVFIQLSKDEHRLLVGDYEISSDSNYFLNYFKKWQGLNYDDKFIMDNDAVLKTSFAAAISRGQYNRNILATLEGNQGPYRLIGAEGEPFIIIIAATERVYLDGVLLERGIEEDYTIDYNTAEIVFTPNRLITKDVRIAVDFEYNNQNYLRSGLRMRGSYEKEKSKIYVSLYSEQDSRNTNSSSGVGINQRQQLALLGDNLEGAFGSSIQAFEEEDQNPITYNLVDSLSNGILFDSVLVFSITGTGDLFTAQFSFVGANQGDYIIVPGSNNGTIYQWTPPIGNIQQGDFEPISRLSAPQRTSMLTIGGRHQFKNKWTIESEIAASNQDLNRFSSIDNGDNPGIATFTKLNYSDRNVEKSLTLDAGFNYEFVQGDFSIINPFRNAEFNRDWNLQPGAELEQQHFVNGYFQVNKKDFFKLNLTSSFLDNAIGVQGFKQSADVYFSKNGFTFISNPSLLKSKTIIENSTFWRPNFDAYQAIGKSSLKLGFRTIIEKNTRQISTDSLSQESIHFSRYEAYLENDPAKKLHIKLLLAKRIDRLPQAGDFALATTADELNIQGHWKGKTSQNLNWNFTARNLKVNNAELSNDVDLQTYLGKLSYSFQALKGIIRSTTAYELGSGQESKRTFTYIEVEPGKGIFQWVDYNEDQVQQIEEFEIAPNIDQATFIRIERPTLDFIETQNVLLNENLQLGLKPIWFDELGLKKFISRFSTSTNVQVSRKNRKLTNFAFWNPFNLAIEEEGVVTAQSLIRNNLYFNRGNPNFDIYIGRSNVFSAQSLDIGVLKNGAIENYAHYQVKIKPWMSHTLDLLSSNRTNDASIFQQRNFEIELKRVNPALRFLLSKTFNATIQYAWESQENQIGLRQSLTKNEFNFALGFQNINNRSIDISVIISEIDFEGELNDPVSFTLLEGLQGGSNLEWQMTANQQLSKNLQLSINYNGRKAGDLQVVHFGNLQVKATF